MTTDEVLRRAKKQKTVRVLVKCWLYLGDDTPVNEHGEGPGSRNWKHAWEWGKRSRRLDWLLRYPDAWKAIPATETRFRRTM